MSIAMSKTRERFPLSTKKIVKKTIGSMIGWFITLAIANILLIIVMMSPASVELSNALNGQYNPSMIIILATIIIFFIFLLIFLVTYLYQKWYFEVYFYDLTDSFIIIKKGVITPREITIPYERVQDVYVDQDIFDRIFGLYDVHLSSATVSSGMEAHIDGLENLAAMGVREVLLKIVSEKISRRTNIPQQVANNQISNG